MAPWQKPWTPGERRLPEHLVSGHAYWGVNALHLSVTQTAKGYRDNRWATATQIQALGGQVRPGEQATPVLFDTMDDERQAQHPPGAPDTDQPPGGEQDHEQTRPPMVRVHAAFNVEQADGLTLERRDDDRDKRSEGKTHQLAKRIIMESGVDVRHVRGDRSFYNLQTDRATLPERDQFASANGYYQIVLHELGHATGHPDRLDRATLTNGVRDFGSVEYAREELRAEISAMLTGARVGVGHDGSRGATYVKGWVRAVSVYSIVQVKGMPHVGGGVHVLGAVTKALQNVCGEVVILEVLKAALDHLTQVEGLGAPSLRRQHVKPVLGLWIQSNRRRHVAEPPTTVNMRVHQITIARHR